MRKSIIVLSLLIIPLLSNAQTEHDKIGEFGKIWGYMKYFHPDVQKGKIDWDSVFIKYYPLVKNAPDKNRYNDIIGELQRQISVVRKLSVPYKYFPKDTTYSNLDFNWISKSTLLSESNKGNLMDILINYKPSKNIYFKKEQSYYSFKNVNYREYKPLDEAHSFLSLFTFWNRINYCFGYKRLMDIPWDKTLTEFIPRFEQAAGKMDVYLVLAELTTRINDSHGEYSNGYVRSTLGRNLPFTSVANIEGKYIIRSIPDTLSKLYNINIGDRIDSINGVDVNSHRKMLMKYVGGSNPAGIERNMKFRFLNLRYFRNNRLSLTDTFNNHKLVNLYLDQAFDKKMNSITFQTKANLPYKIIQDKYGYINMSQLKRSDIKKVFHNFRKCNAIIIDWRNYNHKFGILAFAKYLKYDAGEPFFKYYKMDKKYPGSYKLTNMASGYWISKYDISFFRKKFKGSILVLIDENTQSAMEFQTMWAKVACNAILVGRPTAGADGAAKPFIVNPYFGAQYTGDIVLWPDGGQTQRIGIQPDILVKPTWNGIIKGQDEILNSALLYLEKH